MGTNPIRPDIVISYNCEHCNYRGSFMATNQLDNLDFQVFLNRLKDLCFFDHSFYSPICSYEHLEIFFAVPKDQKARVPKQ